MEKKLPEFEELKNKINLLEIAVKEEEEAKIIMDLKEKNSENSGEAIFYNKQERWEKRSILKSSLIKFINSSNGNFR